MSTHRRRNRIELDTLAFAFVLAIGVIAIGFALAHINF